MKKNILIFLSSLMFLFVGCSEKYSDAVEVNQDFIAVMNNYIDNLEKADSAKKIAGAMDEFADAMTKIGPRLKAVSEKYPELKDENNQPEVFKKIQKESEEMQKRFSTSFMKTMQYMQDPAVQKAHQRIAAAMQAMAR